MPERLQKVIANAGVASRRAAEKLIVAGKVRVNGQTVTQLGTKVKGDDQISVNGQLIKQTAPKRYILLYKPRGVISAASDDKGRKVVTDCVPEVTERIYPVGRLDYDTSGLLLLTNDGEFANEMMHPRYKINKTYYAKVQGIPSNEALEQLRHGIVLDGKKTSGAKAKILKVNRAKQTSLVSLTIHEGRNHQVKKMFLRVGHPVQKLTRQTYAFLDLSGLTAGQYRELSHNEVRRLKEMVNAPRSHR